MSEPRAGSRRKPKVCGGDPVVDEVAAAFRESFRALWLIAVSVVRDETLAEDVVQESAVVALGKLKSFRSGTNAGAWLAGIVRNVARNRARSEKHRRMASLDPGRLDSFARRGSSLPAARQPPAGRPEAPVSPFRAVSFDQPHFDDAVVSALNRLEDMPRACLLLRTLEGMPYAKIAALLDIPEGTAMSHVHRARRQMRATLRGEETSVRNAQEKRNR